MELLSIIRTLEAKANADRRIVIERYLQKWDIPFQLQTYSTGTNLIVHAGKEPFIGLGSHFDAVVGSPGANDNASAIAVVLALLNRAKENPLNNLGLQGFFFDQEEVGLLGSRAYVEKSGIQGMMGLINFELVGMGDQLAIWPIAPKNSSQLVNGVEQSARMNRWNSHRFDQILLHDADHRPFRKAGVDNAFTLTAVSQQDLEVAAHYYRALEFEVDAHVLREILEEAPLFQHYHKATDRSEYLSEQTLQKVVDIVWMTLQLLDQSLERDPSLRTFFQ